MVLQIFGKISRGKFTSSFFVVLRDGEFRGQERTHFTKRFLRLKEKVFVMDAITALGEVHKSSQKIFDVERRRGSYNESIEGSA